MSQSIPIDELQVGLADYLRSPLVPSPFIEQIRECKSFDDLDALRIPYLDENSPKVPINLPGLTCSLLPFQRTSIHYMAEIERNRAMNNGMINIQISAAVLADKPGTGKTFMIFGLIALDLLAKTLPPPTPPVLTFDPPNRERVVNISFPLDKSAIVSRRAYNYMFPCNLILTSGASINQFARAIERYTTFKYFKVSDLHGVGQLYRLIAENRISEYHIILVKNGKIARIPPPPFKIPYTPGSSKSPATIIDAIAVIPIMWRRIIIDDYDTAAVPKFYIAPGARMTWYVSSTTRKTSRVVKAKTRPPASSPAETLLYPYHQSALVLNDTYMRLFTVQNDEEFIKRYNRLTTPIIYLAKFADPNRYINLINNIGANNGEIVDMINANALGEAAALVHATSETAADIFKKLFDNRYEEYKQSAQVLLYVEQAKALQNSLPEPDEEERYLESHLTQGIMPTCKYQYLDDLITRTEDKYQTKLDSAKRAIARVRDSLMNDDCPICMMPLRLMPEDQHIVIMATCCHASICGPCTKQCLHFNEDDGKVVSRESCPMCRAQTIEFSRLIFIKSGMIEDVGKHASPDKANVARLFIPDEKQQLQLKANKKRTKIDALMDIINNTIPVEAKRIDRNIGVQAGTSDEIKNEGAAKVIIYALYGEALGNICTELGKNKIKYWTLGGRPKEIQNTISEFDSMQTPCVLLINGTKYCSGLNLQSGTDLVFFHAITGGSETQIVGRVHRLTRPTTARIHYLLFDNELENFSYTDIQPEVPDPIDAPDALDALDDE